MSGNFRFQLCNVCMQKHPCVLSPKEMKKTYGITCLFTNVTKFVPNIMPLKLKLNRYQRFHTKGLIHEWFIRGVKGRHICGGGGAIRGRKGAYRRRNRLPDLPEI